LYPWIVPDPTTLFQLALRVALAVIGVLDATGGTPAAGRANAPNNKAIPKQSKYRKLFWFLCMISSDLR
jgi:hypothetical protein